LESIVMSGSRRASNACQSRYWQWGATPYWRSAVTAQCSPLALAAPRAVPALGINLGRPGYLAEVDYEHLGRALTALGKGDYFVEGRAALVLRPMADVDLKTARGFNDIVFSLTQDLPEARHHIAKTAAHRARHVDARLPAS
jgi:hypothetical protein